MDQDDQNDPAVIEEVVEATAQDGTSLPIRFLRSPTCEGSDRPLAILYFPGGMLLGGITSMAPLARLLAKKFDVVVTLSTHRFAPEHQFPISYDDGWDTFSWIAENAVGTLRADPKKMIFLWMVYLLSRARCAITFEILPPKDFGRPSQASG
ncbi:hypothetical protein AC578_7740 [Pseudocercospora eumusae]|uniref:Alpha/beta hydrolase fold-3 domain-containing protein n=1 Tax=Pseudocercospora eumusae TaxID=321146 RepID=A0A139HKW8_9PEZI|nr:hypothetical protein AC578_7740 [Pseudocercospora eumusae]